MKKLFYLIIACTGMANAQIANIPDAAFKNALLAASPTEGIAKDQAGNNITINTNGDDEIQVSEALAVYQLFLDNWFGGEDIISIAGIGAFANLEILSLRSIWNVESVDVSVLPNLRVLDVENTQLTALDVSGHTALIEIDASFTPLSALDVSGCTALGSLNVFRTELLTIDVSGLPSLKTLYVGSIFFVTDTLDASDCPQLELIDFGTFGQRHVDVSGCTSLHQLHPFPIDSEVAWETLDASGSGLTILQLLFSDSVTSVNLTGCSQLATVLMTGNSSLHTLDLAGCTALTNLSLSFSEFDNINLADCAALTVLDVMANPLTSIDVSGCPNLETFYVGNNPMIALDLSNNPNITSLWASGCQLLSLDLSALASLETLDCSSNQLTYLNIRNGSTETSLNFASNPSLAYICADESQVDAVQAMALPATMVGSYCSFMPPSEYNTITGTLRIDMDGNGCDASDVAPPYIRVNINEGGNDSAVFTNASGVYKAYRLAGNFTVAPLFENPAAFTANPVSATVEFPAADNLTETRDFCMAVNPVIPNPDMEIVIVPISPASPGFTAAYKIVYKNNGDQIQSGSVLFDFDDAVMNVLSTPPATDSSEGHRSFDFADLLPFETRVIHINAQINSPTATPPVNIDDTLIFSATVNPVEGDLTPLDNAFTLKQIVVGSYDPNDKTCLEGHVVSTVLIGEYLHYVINFENTGTAPATNVVVKDIIDETMFDVSTLQLMEASHPVDARLNGNVAEFIFAGINLEIGGHGNILLKIRTKDNLVVGSEVSNRAEIFFDYNFPIETNLARTSFEMLGVNDPDAFNTISIYPNPAHDVINIKSTVDVTSIQLFDIQGRLLETKIVNETEAIIDLSGKQNGVYFLRIASENGIKTEKVVKQ